MSRIFFFLFGLMLWVGDARADYDPTPKSFMCNQSGKTFDDQQQACQYLSSSTSSPLPYPGGVQRSDAYGSFPGPYGCKTYMNTAGTGTPGTASCSFQWTCPYGGTLTVTTKPVCVGGNPPPPLCTDLNPFIRKFYYNSPKGPYTAPDHYANCQIDPMEMLVCRTDSVGTYCMWKVRRNGAQWTGTDAPGTGSTASESPEVKTDPPTKSPPIRNPPADPKICPTCIPCPAGSVQAGIDADGVPLCVGTGTTPQNPTPPPTTTTKPPTTVTNADGSTTTTQQTVQQNSDGSTSTTTTITTVAADGSKTVTGSTSTTNNTAGTAGRQDTPNTDQMNLCKQNPLLAICQNSTVSGKCGDITCTGDAIQCATLRAAAAMQCKQQQDSDDLKASSAYALGSAVVGGSDPAASTLPSPSKATTVTMPGTLDQAGWLGGGQCFADKVVTVQGRSFVLPYSKACDYLIVLRLGLMVIASLVSFRIVRDAVLT